MRIGCAGSASCSRGSSNSSASSACSNTRARSRAVSSACFWGISGGAARFGSCSLLAAGRFYSFFQPRSLQRSQRARRPADTAVFRPCFAPLPFFAVYFLRGAFAPSPMEAMESRMAVSAMVFFILVIIHHAQTCHSRSAAAIARGTSASASTTFALHAPARAALHLLLAAPRAIARRSSALGLRNCGWSASA